ncbi:MAG TPA: hypothetical protein VJL29_09000 [Thermoguttaceae bacterium]|nr:hypothetical protein [Thermoguttaceae bacterium]
MRYATRNANLHGVGGAARRRGMSLLIVILLVSMATAISYVVLRGQSAALHIQANADLRAAARQAATSGLTYGIQTMHTAEWVAGNGVSSEPMSRNLGPHERFTVAFTVGDAALDPDSPEYDPVEAAVYPNDYAYRVTVHSTGHAEDPEDSSRTASHTMRAVMRLIPRALSHWSNWERNWQANWPSSIPSWPSDWYKMAGVKVGSEVKPYSVYQTHKQEVKLDIPCRLEGYVRLLGKLTVGSNYPQSPSYPIMSTAWQKYMSGLKSMAQYGPGDYRPVNGPVQLLTSSQNSTYFLTLYLNLGFTPLDLLDAAEVSFDWQKPTGLTKYRIYPGGPEYDIEPLPETVQQGGTVALGPEPKTNPLGLFQQTSNCTLRGDVTVHGSVFCEGTVDFAGTAVLEPVNMPALCGSSAPVRLPSLTSAYLNVKSGSATTIQGLVAVFDTLEIYPSSVTLPFTLTGRLVAKKLTVNKRQPWDTANWNGLYTTFNSQSPKNPPYFPQWLATQGYDPVPKIKIAADATPVLYHWNDWSNWNNGIFVPNDADNGGLRWEMLKWKEGAGATVME